MRPSIIRTVLAQNISGTPATISVALGLMGTLSTDIAKDLTAAQRSLGQRRRQQHDEVLGEVVIQAESLAYVARWIADRVRPARGGDELPIVITDLDPEPQPAAAHREPVGGHREP